MPPAADQGTAAGGGLQGPDTGAIIFSAAGTQALERTPEPRPVAGGSDTSSMAQLQLEWVSAGEVSSATTAGDPATAVSPTMLHQLIASYHNRLANFNKATMAELTRVELTVQVSSCTCCPCFCFLKIF